MSGFARLHRELGKAGMTVIGAFEPDEGEIGDARAVVLIGNAGSAMWRRFDPRPHDPRDHTIDCWTRDVLTPLASKAGADIAFPFDGPPYHPFVSWAFRTGRCHRSPLGMAIHDRFGLWFALRAAFLFDEELELPAGPDASPCETCADKPCLTACPVSAFDGGNYDHEACRKHVRTPPNDCASAGCRARHACPTGREFVYEAAHAAYHMRSFAQNG
ncbi:MAG: ferredoxin [Minwuia sp.]|uniref:ferredoxin n=1 Tax=Minwuia sp. TaxID=2493630 RepID=UPI003A8BCC9A